MVRDVRDDLVNMPSHNPPPSGVSAMIAMTHRELIRLTRQPSRVAVAMVTPVVIWLMLAAGLSGTMQLGDGAGGYATYLAPGMASMVIVFTAIFAAMSLIEDADAGFLQSALTSPTPRWSLVGAKILGPGGIGWVQAALLIPAVILIGAEVTAQGLILALLALLLMSVGLTGLCLAMAWRISSAQGFHGVMNIILMPMWVLSGSVMPLDGAAGWLRTIMLINPLTWPTSAMRDALGMGASMDAAIGWPLSAGFAVFGVAAAAVVMRRPR